MSFRTRSLITLLIASVVFVVTGGPALAVHDAGTFELDGDAANGAAPGDDWANLYAGGGSAIAFTFIPDGADPPQDTSYLHTGGSKDIADITEWVRTTTDEAPDKDEIVNAYAAAYHAGGDFVVYFGADRFAQNGDAAIGFWFVQDDVSIDGTNVLGAHQDGDILVLSDFVNGGSVPEIRIFEWVGSGGSDGPIDEITPAGMMADCAVAGAGDDACAIVNDGSISVPWSYLSKTGTTTVPKGGFFEGGINLTDLGVATDCFSTFIAETRTSHSVDARLKDIALGDFDTCATKSGTKFEDLNADGDRDAGEPGLEGWTIHLFGSGEHRHDVTDANGHYEFGALEPGAYTVCETLKPDWHQSMPSSGANCSGHDHDGPAGPKGYAIELDFGEVDSGNDFGNYKDATKEGVKFEDLNADGNKDAGEPLLPGWTIHLFDGNGTHLHDVTDDEGAYSFSVKPGSYKVCESLKPAWSQSKPDGSGTDCSGHTHDDTTPGPNGYAITLTSGEVDRGNNFGNFRGATKTGTKFDDLDADGVKDGGEPGLPGWNIHLFGTDGQGNDVHEHDVTDGSGVYAFNVPPGHYTVCESMEAGWTQSLPNAGADCSNHGGGIGYEITLTSGQLDSGNDFGNFQPGTKSGTKFEDLDGDGVRDGGEHGLAGWTIHIFDKATGGQVVDQHAITDANGDYSFMVPPGTYIVCEEQQAGWIQSHPTAGADCSGHGGGVGYEITLASGGTDRGNDFGNYRTATKAGTKFEDLDADGVRDEGEPGVPGWTIHIFNGSVHRHVDTDADGAYTFEGLDPGTYTVCESSASGWTQSYPTSGADCSEHGGGIGYEITLSSNELDEGNDFGNFRDATKEGTKFEDLDGDGVRDEGEPGVPGWTIHLSGTDGQGNPVDVSTETDAEGHYSFEVPPGTYLVCEAMAAGWTQSHPSSGADCSAHDGGVGYDITLTSNEADSGNDFGNFRNATKTGVKFEDLNADGEWAQDEPLLPGWEIHLMGTDGLGNAVHEHAVTDADGRYTFSVPPGSYVVCETMQPGWTQSVPGAGADCLGHDHGGSVIPGPIGYDITVTSNQLDEGNDFGNFLPGDKQGTKFDDLDADGVRDTGEPGLPGWTIHIADAATGGEVVHQHAVTGEDGSYAFSVPPGDYLVCEQQVEGWIQSHPSEGADCSEHGGGIGYAITLTSGGLDGGNDFGNYRLASKQGTKFDDLNGDGDRDAGEPGIAGWEIHLAGTDGSGNQVHEHTTTDANGEYSFDVPPGSYVVCETLDTSLVSAISIETTVTPVSGSPGDTVTYAYAVTNTGTAALLNVRVFDSEFGIIGTIPVLGPGSSATLTRDDTLGTTAVIHTGSVTARGAYAQTMPAEGADCSAHSGGVGYDITLISGQVELANDFGNARTPVADSDPAAVTIVLAELPTTGTDPRRWLDPGIAFLAVGCLLSGFARRRQRRLEILGQLGQS